MRMKGVYWLILLQYSIVNINSQVNNHEKFEPTTVTSPTGAPETNTNIPKQFHPNYMSPHGALDYGPFGTHPMSRVSGQSNMMYPMSQIFDPANPDMFPMVPPPVAAEMMAQQLPPGPQMYPGPPSNPQMYPGQPQPPSQQMYPGQQHNPQMFPGQPMMSPTDPRAFRTGVDHPAILPVMTPDQNPLVSGTFLPNPFLPLEHPFSTHPATSNNPEQAEWFPPQSFGFGDIPPTKLPFNPTPIPDPGFSFNSIPENFFPDMHPLSNPQMLQYLGHMTPAPEYIKQQQYYHPQPDPPPDTLQHVGEATTSKLSSGSQGSEVAPKVPGPQSESHIGPLPAEGSNGNNQSFQPPGKIPQGPGGPVSHLHQPMEFFSGPISGSQFPPDGGPFLSQPFSQQSFQMQASELGATGPRSSGPFPELLLSQQTPHLPFQSKGIPFDSQQFQKPHVDPNQGFSPFNFMPPFPQDPFLLPITHSGERPEVQPGGHVPMDPAAEPGDFPGIMEYENPFAMPPPPPPPPHPFFNGPAPQFPVLPPFLEGLPAPSENGQNVPGKKWSYKNSGHLKWTGKYSYCSGNRQSPIDIDDRNIIYTPNLKPFTFTGFDGFNTAFTVKNNGHTASIRVSGNMSVRGGGFGDIYNTAEIHFHWGSNDRDGSEHAINGRKYPLEMHIVNYATKYGDLKNAMQYRDGLGVLGVLFDIGPENSAFAEIERQLKKVQNPGTSAPLPTIDVRQLLPVNSVDYFRYYGSLTTPPCYQSVLWTIFEQRQTISPNQLESLRSLYETTKNAPEPPNSVIFGEALTNNFRPLQPMFGRIINTNIKRYANPIYLAHPGMVINPVVFQQSAPLPTLTATSKPLELIPLFHPNKVAAKSTGAATATAKQRINQLTASLPPQQVALNKVEPQGTTIPTVSSFRGTNGSVITVVDVPGNVSKPAELIVVNTSRLVEQLKQPAIRPAPVTAALQAPMPAALQVPPNVPVAILTTTAPQTTTHLKQLHPVMALTAAKTTPAITSVIPTLLPLTTSTKTPTSTAPQTPTILTPKPVEPTSPTLRPSTTSQAISTASSTSTVNSQLKEVVQNFPSQSQQSPSALQSNSVPAQFVPAPVPPQPIELIPEPEPTVPKQSSANVVVQSLNIPNLEPIIAARVPSVGAQLPNALTQGPLLQVANPVDLSPQIVSDPLLQSTTPSSTTQKQFTQRIIQEARKAAIEAAHQQLALGSQHSPEFTKSVIEAATKAAQAQIARLMATQQFLQTEPPLPIASTAEPQSIKLQIGRIDPIQPMPASTANQLAQHAVNQAVQQNLIEQLRLEQQAPVQAAQQLVTQLAGQQKPFEKIVDQQQVLDQQTVNKAFQQNLAQQLLLEQQAPVQVAQQLAIQQGIQQNAQQVVDQQQLRDQKAVNQAVQHNLAQQLLLLEQQAPVQAAQQLAIQQGIQQNAQQVVDPQQLRDQKAVNQAVQQNLAQQLLLEQPAPRKAQQPIQQQPASQTQPAANTATQQTVQQQLTPALLQLLAQQLANQQAAKQSAQQQIAQQVANQAAQKQIAQQAANQVAQKQIAQQAAQQAANQAAQQQAANQAAQQQIAQQAANQAAQQQVANQAAQQQIAQQAANQAAQQQPATQAQLIKQVLADMKKLTNYDKLNQQQIIKLVANRVIQRQNQQQSVSSASQIPSNPLVSQQLRQQSRSPNQAPSSALTQPSNQLQQRTVNTVSGVTTNRQGTSAKKGNILIQPSAQGTPVVSILRKAPQPVQTIQSNRPQTWVTLQRARANAQAKAQAKSQALTAAKSVSVLVPRQTSVVPTVRFASTSQKLHPVNVLPNQARAKTTNTVTQQTSSNPRSPASQTGSQSNLIQAYLRALSVSKPEIVPVLRRVRTQYGDTKLLNYLQKKFGRLRTV